jgi:uncharacterized protein (DUF1778 family)
VKVITIRLSDEEYKLIAEKAKAEYRPISNYITAKVLSRIQETMYVDRVEEEEIRLDKDLQKRLSRGIKDAKQRKGRMVG